MEKTMKSPRLPKSDSVKKLAQFWDRHDLTDFESDLEEVSEPVFERRTVIPIDLEAAEAKAVKRIAKKKGIPDSELLRGWVQEKIRAS